MGLYAADGSIRVTVVDGTVRTGLYAADGSWNVVLSDGVGFAGVYHPCGGYWVTVLTSGPAGIYATDGSLYVQETPYTYSGGLRVTVVSGSLGSLTAPVLTLLTDATDNTPLWSFDLVSPLAGDVIRIEWDDAIPYAAQVSFSDYTITSGDISTGDYDFDFGLSAFANGPWSWRSYHRRGGSSSAVSNAVTLTIAADVTAPTLSSPVDASASDTTGTGSVSTNEGNGTLYFVVSTSASAPSAAQVKAGQMHTGAAAADSGSQAVAGTGVQTITGGFTGLTAATTYYAHYMHEDASANQSSVSSGDGFTTDAVGATYSRTASTNFVGTGTSHTFTGVNIGTASATRVVLVAAFCAGGATTVSSLTIGGNAASLITGTNLSSSGVGSSVYALVVASGATADIEVTWNTSVTSMGIIVYALDGVNSTESAKNSGAGFGASRSNTLTIPSAGFAITFSLLQNAASAGTFSNCVEDGSRVFVAGGTGVPMQSAHNVTAGSQSPTMTPGASDIIILHSIAYGP